jgi:hypothetical protein
MVAMVVVVVVSGVTITLLTQMMILLHLLQVLVTPFSLPYYSLPLHFVSAIFF